MAALRRVAKAAWMGSKWALDRRDVEEAVTEIHRGDLVVYPTDTLYGLGADATSAEAVRKVATAKGRPEAQPVSVAVQSLGQIEAWAEVDEPTRAFLRNNLPGPFTVVLKPMPAAPRHLVSPQGIAFRMPRHPIALLLAKLAGPITATSANRHGGPSPADVATAVDQLGDAVSLYIDAGPAEYGAASTVVDLTSGRPKILRQGPVPEAG